MNLAILDFNDLNNYTTLVYKLNNLRQQCNFNKINSTNGVFYILYSSDRPFDNNNKKFFIDLEIIAHLKIIDNTNLKYSPSPTSKKIKTPIQNKEFLEIYDVCVNYNYRNKKIISNLLKYIITTQNKRYWLCVDVNNIYFESAIKSYINAGFGNPQLKNYLLSGETFYCDFIELTTPNIQEASNKEYTDKEYMINLSNNLRNFNKLVSTHTCKINIFLSIDLTNLLFDTLNYDIEVSGSFQKYIKSTNIYQDIELIFSKSNMILGEEYGVKLPGAEFVFHTHPNACYNKLGCFILWPSGIDMASTIKICVYYYLKCHLVITVEGIYFLSLTPEFQYFLMVLSQSENLFEYIFPILTDNILKIFTEKEDLRHIEGAKQGIFKKDDIFEYTEILDLNDYEKNIVFQRWKYTTNNLRIKQVFDNTKFLYVNVLKKYNYVLDGLNFKLYNAKLIKWKDIGKTDGINMYLEYVSDKCNIVSTEVNNYIEMLTDENKNYNNL